MASPGGKAPDRSLLPAPTTPGATAGGPRRRPQRKAKNEELQARLQNALIIEAQKEAVREREKRIAAEREKKIEQRNLPAQAHACISQLSVWDSETQHVVTRMLTPSELANRTQSYEGLVMMEGKPRRQGLIVSAIRSGSLDLIQSVLKELGSCTGVFDVTNFNSPLHYAAVTAGSGDIVRALMDAGHKPTVHNRYGWTPLDFARHCGNDIAAEILQEKPDASRFAANVGKDTAAVDEEQHGSLLVLTAVRARQTDLIKFIVPRVPDAGQCSEEMSGNTALHYAVLVEDNPLVVMLLLQANADLDKRNVQGRTAANLAQVKQRSKSVALMQRWRVADREERDVIVAEVGSEEAIAMMKAQQEKERQLAKMLEDQGVDDSAMDMKELEPEDPRPASRGGEVQRDAEAEERERIEGRRARKGAERFDINSLLEEEVDLPERAEADGGMGMGMIGSLGNGGSGMLDGGSATAAMLDKALQEIRSLRSKVEGMEEQFSRTAMSASLGGDGQHHGGGGGGLSHADLSAVADQSQTVSNNGGQKQQQRQETPPSRPKSRPNTADAVSASAMEEVFHKLQLLQRRIDEHELNTETQSQALTRQQENALYQINAKMAQISSTQRQTTEVLAETNVRLDRTLHFDSAGQPNMPGKMIVRVQSAHGLLHLEKAKPPSPYFVLSLMSQVNVSAVSPETRNPLWDKEMVFDVPNQPSKLILSVLDRTITGTDTIVILGKAEISLNVPPNEDIEDWHDLVTDDFGMVHQHAGSVRVRRRFVPLSEWGEYQRKNQASASLSMGVGPPGGQGDVQDSAHYGGLYLMLLSGEGLAPAGQPLVENTKCQIVFDQGDSHFETPWRPLGERIEFGTMEEEFYCGEVDTRLMLKFYLCYESQGNIDRAAYCVLNVEGFPYMQMYEDWHLMDVNAGMGNIKPRLRLAFFRGPKPDPHDDIVCTMCGLELPRVFQAPHLSVSCPKYFIPCPHQRVGCQWQGPRTTHKEHLNECPFEQLRESIYATASDIRGVKTLLVAGSKTEAGANATASTMSYVHAAVPVYLRTLHGHKRPVTSLVGVKTTGQLLSADTTGYVIAWTLESDKELDTFRAHQGEVSCFLWDKSFSSYVFTGGAYPDDTVKVWDSSDFSLERKMLGGGQNFAVNGLAAMRYGTPGETEFDYLYSVDDSADIKSWDAATGECLASAAGHELGIKTIVANDGNLVTGSLDMTVKIWNPSTLECIGTLDCLGDSVMQVIFVGSKWLLAAGTHSIRIWDFVGRQLYRVLDGSRWPMCFADGMLFAAESDVSQNIQVFTAMNEDPNHWSVVDVLKGHAAEVTSVIWFQQTLITGSKDKTIRLWRAPTKDSLVQ